VVRFEGNDIHFLEQGFDATGNIGLLNRTHAGATTASACASA
jgi:hypothetical protein